MQRKEKVDLMDLTSCAIDEIVVLITLAAEVNGMHSKHWMR